MKGSSHAIVGGIVGGVVSFGIGNDLVSVGTGTLVAAGTVGGLVPDLDTNGKLSGKMTLSHTFVRTIMMIVGLIIAFYSVFGLDDFSIKNVIGVGVGSIMFMASKFVTQKRMLMVTGIGITLAGIALGVVWIIMLGAYVVIASNLGHRTYTHSLIGLVYFAVTVYLMNMDMNVEGLFITLVLAYVSHLVCDFKVFNKQGVKIFRPFINLEF